jgi:cell division protein FtsQ
VQSARVRRSWPDAIVIVIRQRTAAFAVPAQGGYDVVDGFGVDLAWRQKRPPGLPVLLAPAGPVAALRGSQAVLAAGRVLQSLPVRLRHLVTGVRAPGPATVTLILRGGATVLWGGTDRAVAKADELVILLRTRARYYDVSDPGTAVTGS